MLDKFKEFLIENKVLEAYCDCLLNIGEGYNDNNLVDMSWADAIDCAFSWDDADDYLNQYCDWHAINIKWSDLMHEEPTFGNWVGFHTNQAFVNALLKVDKKRILLNRLKEFMW